MLSSLARLTSGQVVIAVAALTGSVIVARGLTVEERGVLSSVLLLTSMIFSLSELGVVQSATRFVVQNSGKVRGTFRLAAQFSGVRTLILGPLIALILLHLHIVPWATESALTYTLAMLAIIPSFLSSVLLGVLLGKDSIKAYNNALIILAVINISIIALLFASCLLSVDTILAAEAVVNVIFTTVLAAFCVINEEKGKGESLNCTEIKGFFSFGFSVYISSILSFFQLRIVNLIAVNSFSLTTFGLFSLAQSAVDRLYLLSDSLSTYIFPLVSSASPKKLEARVFILILFNFIAGVMIASLLYGLASVLIIGLFGEKYTDAVNIFRALLVNVPILGSWRLISQAINGVGRASVTAALNIIGIMVLALVYYFKGQGFGVNGLIFSTVAQNSVMVTGGLAFLILRNPSLQR